MQWLLCPALGNFVKASVTANDMLMPSRPLMLLLLLLSDVTDAGAVPVTHAAV